jgi:betaine-aldehyde dehydrogenase
MRAQPKASHWIGGPVEDTAGPLIDVIYPATGEVIAQVHGATDDILEQALTAAGTAQKIWATWTGVERARVLRRAADLMRDRNQELSELETLDTGKPIQETLVADATSAADALEWFAGLAQGLGGDYIPLGRDFAFTSREPLGVCAGIGAWNYPTQVAGWKVAPALACGNAMVFKPSETTPLSALALATILEEAGAPKGLFCVVQGAGDVGAKLVTDPRVAKVSVTGSVPTGQKVAKAAAGKPVTLELGGKSPLIIFADADLEDAVSAAILGNFYSSGQVCSNATRVFVQVPMVEKFLKRLVERTKNAVMGDPLDPATQLGPLVSKAQQDRVLGFIDRAIADGVRVVCGGHAVEGPGYFVAPTVFADVTDDMEVAREEVFGPVMSVLSFDTEDEVIARANATRFGLAAGVFTQDLTRGHRVVRQLEAGTCWINAYNLTPVEVPFGGVKGSGLGRENGRIALEYYTQLRSVYVGMGPVDAPY